MLSDAQKREATIAYLSCVWMLLKEDGIIILHIVQKNGFFSYPGGRWGRRHFCVLLKTRTIYFSMTPSVTLYTIYAIKRQLCKVFWSHEKDVYLCITVSPQKKVFSIPVLKIGGLNSLDIGMGYYLHTFIVATLEEDVPFPVKCPFGLVV